MLFYLRAICTKTLNIHVIDVEIVWRRGRYQHTLLYQKHSFEVIKKARTYIRVVFNVAGDIGGYMGLLLGGTVITVFEFIDFFAYNVIDKIVTKRKQKTKVKDNSHDGKETPDRKPDISGTNEVLSYVLWFKYCRYQC